MSTGPENGNEPHLFGRKEVKMWRLFENYNLEELVEKVTWIQEMKGVPQDPIHHAEGDVFTHTQMVVEALLNLVEFNQLKEADQHQLIAAALMHDIEKRSTTFIENGRVRSPGHAKKGEKTVREILYRNGKTPFAIRENIAKLVRLHGLPLWAIEKPDFERVLLSASLNVNTSHLYILAKADALGRICADQNDLLDRLEYFKGLCQELRCWGQAYPFESDLSRFNYFINEGASRFYDPYGDKPFEVTLLSALPGSGKDSWIKNNKPEEPIISLDDMRRNLKIKPTDKSGNGKVIQAAKNKARTYLRKQQPFIWNATNITGQLRSQLIQLFADYGAGVRIVYLEVPYQTLLQRNKTRQHPLPPAVLERMIRKLEPPVKSECTELVLKTDY